MNNEPLKERISSMGGVPIMKPYTYTDIERIIESKDRIKAGMTAPAEGLYLNKVIY
jgi:hypothetical protein